MDVVKIDKNFKSIGKKHYTENEFYRDLSSLMFHPEFRRFVDKYLLDDNYTLSTIMFMRTVQHIQKLNPDYDPYEIIGIVHSLVSNNKTRQMMIKHKSDYKKLL